MVSVNLIIAINNLTTIYLYYLLCKSYIFYLVDREVIQHLSIPNIQLEGNNRSL